MSKVSVIVPAYNAGSTIERCILSLTKQTYKNMEILVVDDGSTDNTDVILKKMCEEYHNIIYVYQENSGVSAARNTGIKRATGEWLAFCDSDDYVRKDYVEIMVKSQKKYKSDWVFGGFIRKNGSKEYVFDSPLEDKELVVNLQEFAAGWYKNQYIAGVCGVLFNKKIIDTYEIWFPIGINHGEDTIFNMEYFKYCNSISCVKEAIYTYVEQEGSLTTKFDIGIWDNQSLLMNYFSSLCEYRHFSKIVKDSFAVRCITISMNSFASHKCSLKKWNKLCNDIIVSHYFRDIKLNQLKLDKFGYCVLKLLKGRHMHILWLIFKLKIFMYENMQDLYYMFRR